MESLCWFWAKLGQETWPETYHPVICHLIDVAAVTAKLWEQVIRSQIRAWLSNRLALDQNACGCWLAFWAGAHDIGKVSPNFQSQGKTTELKRRLTASGYNFAHTGKPASHGEVSTAVLVEALAQGQVAPRILDGVARNVAVAVGGHHGFFSSTWDQISGALGNSHWTEARCGILALLARLCGVTTVKAPEVTMPADQSIWMYVAGLTSVADWIGSNRQFFKPKGNPASLDKRFDDDGYFKWANDQAFDALKTLGWLGRAVRAAPVAFVNLFPFKPRPLQAAVAEIVAGIKEPRLVLVEAPMGEGKTEAAWFAADCWERGGCQGAYVALPTMATSNQMFERVEKFLERGTGKKNLMLLHGKALLNEKFERLQYEAQVYDEIGNRPSAVVAESWFAADKKQSLLAPYGVGTIDQALLAVLQTKHVFVRLFGLAGKCVILDEVHAYDAYMTTLMERLLRWLGALQCPVVLLSATLPRDKRLKLLRAYAGENVAQPDGVPYPRVTTTAIGGPVNAKHVEPDIARKKLEVQLGWLNDDGIGEKLRQALANGGCAAVIRNAVGLAQETYRVLKTTFTKEIESGELRLDLFHARFPFGRRKAIEDGVLTCYGPTKEDKLIDGRIESAPNRPRKSILVATQVVEQSLDLDFDLMILDLAPVDLVLQLAGRLHRHSRLTRPSAVWEPQLWLITPKCTLEDLPDFGVTGIIYSPYILLRSLLVLTTRGETQRTTILLPDEIDGLVEGAYTELEPPVNLPGQVRVFWIQLRAEHDRKIANENDEAERRQIRKPQHTGALARLVSVPREEENPDLHPAHQALTRLTRPTAQLICLETAADGTFRRIHDGQLIRKLVVRKKAVDRVKDIRRLVAGEVTTAHPGVLRELWRSPRRRTEWSDVGMLCQHHLIAFTDGHATIGPYELLLDNDLGLQVVRTNEQGEDE